MQVNIYSADGCWKLTGTIQALTVAVCAIGDAAWHGWQGDWKEGCLSRAKWIHGAALGGCLYVDKRWIAATATVDALADCLARYGISATYCSNPKPENESKADDKAPHTALSRCCCHPEGENCC